MALQTDYDFHGMTIPNAYLRVEGIEWGYSTGMSAVVAVYAEKESPNAITSFQIPAVPIDEASGQSIIGTIYAALKQTPQLSNAVDV